MSDYALSPFWQYVKPGELATCDDCGVSQRIADVRPLLLHGKTAHRCRDREKCARWKSEGAVNAPPQGKRT